MKLVSLFLACILSFSSFGQHYYSNGDKFDLREIGIWDDLLHPGEVFTGHIDTGDYGVTGNRGVEVTVTQTSITRRHLDRAEMNIRLMGSSQRDLSYQESRVLRSIQWQMTENLNRIKDYSANFDRDSGEMLRQYQRQIQIGPSGAVRVIEPTNGLGFDSSMTYYGSWKDKKEHGFGVQRSESFVGGEKIIERFEGSFAQGYREGFGKLSRGDLSYEGSFKRDRFDGFGHMVRTGPEGFQYVGDWKAGREDGVGYKTYNHGTKISGNFQQGQPEGFAQTIVAPGNTYTGHYDRGFADGHGVMDMTSLEEGEFSSLSGDFMRSQLRGTGVARTRSGETRIGNFEGKERQVNQGIRFSKDNTVFGNFDRGMKVVKVDQDVALGTWTNEGFQEISKNPTSEDLGYPVVAGVQASREVLKKGFKGVEVRFNELKKLHVPDPVFKNTQTLHAAKLLAETYQEGAEELFDRALSQPKPSPTTLALGMNYLRSAHEVLRFAEGIGSGLIEQSLVSIRDDAASVVNFVRSDLTDVRKLVDSVIAVKETLASPEFYGELQKFTEQKWQEFQEADSFKKGQMVRDLVAAQIPGLLTAGLGGAIKGTKVMQALTRMAKNPLLKSSERLKELVGDLSKQSPPQGVVRVLDEVSHLVHNQRGSTTEASELLSTVAASGGIYQKDPLANADKILKALKDHGNLDLTNRELIRGWAHSFRFSPLSADKADELAKNLFLSPHARDALGSTPSGRPAFYLATDGKAVPATGYKHFRSSDQRLMEAFASTGVIPDRADGNYITFNRFSDPAEASSWLQVTHDAAFRITLDTRDRVDDFVIPRANYGSSDYLEPVTVSQSFGSGGATQSVTTKGFSRVLEIKNLRTGEILYPKQP
jgi:hypothetical protein